MRVGLFTGIETFTWGLADFDTLVARAKVWGFDFLCVKIYEITQGDWYTKLGGSKVVIDHLKVQGLDVLPYGYFYGNNPHLESLAVHNYLGVHGAFCMDMEAEFDNAPQKISPFVTELRNHVGDLYISTWANVVDHKWTANIKALDPHVKRWMPQVYFPYDQTVYKAQWLQALPTLLKVAPTWNATPNMTSPQVWSSPCDEFTVWEYQQL